MFRTESDMKTEIKAFLFSREDVPFPAASPNRFRHQPLAANAKISARMKYKAWYDLSSAAFAKKERQRTRLLSCRSMAHSLRRDGNFFRAALARSV
jgi:hypothetical protein